MTVWGRVSAWLIAPEGESERRRIRHGSVEARQQIELATCAIVI